MNISIPWIPARPCAAARAPKFVVLRPNEVWSAAVGAGQSVRCERGVLWLTQSGQRRDIILRAGQAWTAPGRGLVVAQAMGSSLLCLEEPRAGRKYLSLRLSRFSTAPRP